MKIKTLLAASAGALALAASAAPAQAYVFGFSCGLASCGVGIDLILDGSTTVTGYDSGWYDDTGFHGTDNDNYIVSNGDLGVRHNNWFAFDLSNLQGTFSTAEIRLNSYTVTDNYTYLMFDYGGSISALTGGTGGVSAYNDLASGTSYGNFAYGVGDTNTFRTLSLNAAAVSDINAAVGGTFALGGTLEAGVAVPEPATWAMMLLGFFGLGGALRARKTAAAAA